MHISTIQLQLFCQPHVDGSESQQKDFFLFSLLDFIYILYYFILGSTESDTAVYNNRVGGTTRLHTWTLPTRDSGSVSQSVSQSVSDGV